jgi:hypothetical protein
LALRVSSRLHYAWLLIGGILAWKLLKFCADGWYVTNFCHWQRLWIVLALLWHSSERQNRNN